MRIDRLRIETLFYGISAALVAPLNDLAVFSVRMTNQEASSSVRFTASQCLDLSGHGRSQRCLLSGPSGKASGIASIALRASVVPPATVSPSTTFYLSL